MISRIIEFSVRNRWLVIFAWLMIAVWGIYAVLHTPIDAIPDLSENQVIVFADWMGRSPQDIEEQVTYPLSTQLQGLAGVKAIRSSSEPNFSMINVIFEEKMDPYFARQRILERLTTVKQTLPSDVNPVMAPDATALGQIVWFTVEGEGLSLDELRALQDFNIRYQLTSVPGVAEVASVGGFVREYQIDVDPAKLRAYGLSLSSLYAAISGSNLSVGGKVVVSNNAQYQLRGIGWLRGVKDLEDVVVTSRSAIPIRIKDLATVQLGPEFRESALEKNGHEAVGGVVLMRFGENPLAVTKAIKEKIRQIQPGLPAGVRIVPFYDRTRLIESAIHTVTGTLREEMIIACIAILLILSHFRSAIVVCVTLPLAVLIAFLFMYYLQIPSNIMSLSGIAISIGILVDAAVVMVENASHELKQKFGDQPVTGDTTEVVVKACRLVGTPIFFSVLIMLLSFLPVFLVRGQAGKLSHPLAFTKSFAMVGVAFLGITLVPALIPLLIRGRLKGEEQNWIVRSFIHLYKPMLTWMIERSGIVWWMMAVLLVVGASLLGSDTAFKLIAAFGTLLILLGMRKGRLIGLAAFLAIAFLADTRLPKLGSEFMPELNEGSLMDMPTSAPRIAMSQAVDDVMVRDRLIRSFPEVELVVGKIGRADTATDPSPIEMVETIITMRPADWWPRRKLNFSDALDQAAVVAAEMQTRGWLKAGKVDWKLAAKCVEDEKLRERNPQLGDAVSLLNKSAQNLVEQFDRSMRELARRRQVEYEPALADQLSSFAVGRFVSHVRDRHALVKEPTSAQLQAIAAATRRHAQLLAESPRQEEMDLYLGDLRKEFLSRGLIANRDDLLLDSPGALKQAAEFVERAVGSEPAGFSERILGAIEAEMGRLWHERNKTLDWELFDHAPDMINAVLIDQLYRNAPDASLAGSAPAPEQALALRSQLNPALAKSLFLWRKTKDNIQDELDSELQMPGWNNNWTQPIKNRISMLATGVRSDIGIKIFGPTNKSLPEALADMQRISEEVRQKLIPIPGTKTPGADQTLGKRYLEIEIDREKAARYGVNVSDINQAIETAIGGSRITTTVEGRERFPVRLRYAREYWQDIDAIKNVLVAANTTPAQLQLPPSSSGSSTAGPGGTGGSPVSSKSGGMGGGMSTSSSPIPMNASQSKSDSSLTPPSSSLLQIPLKMVADIRIVEGPSMIKSENGRLRNYVTLNVRGRDIVGFVAEAKAALKPIEQQLAGTGMTIEWTGEFENIVQTMQTLYVVMPIVIVVILLLLYFTFKDITDALLIFLAVFGALAGSVMFQALFGFNFSIIVAIGYIAALGMATQTGVIMLVYLHDAINQHGGLENISSLDELRQCVINGAVHRLRPKLLTEGTAIVGLVPMLWAAGTGAEIMRPMAAPVLGGLLLSDEVIDLMIPVLFYQIRKRRWLKLHKPVEKTAREEMMPALSPA
jgi:Cu(I)/Ag(I) efflux system membrane protein CusA/SilA